MKRLAIALAIGVVAAASAARGQESGTDQDATTEPSEIAASEEFAGELEKNSYALGYSFGKGIRSRKIEVAVEELLEGMRDAVTGQEGRLGQQEVVVITQQLQNAANRRLAAERQDLIAKNRAAGEAFMAENQARPEVVSLPSGLQYEILQEGDGPKPQVEDTVTVHYSTTTIDGTVVDSSRDRGAPATLRPDRVVPAWTEALPMMSVGSIWRLFTPTDLGFGDDQASTNIPPGATLVFEIELLSIDPGTDEVEEDGSAVQE